MILRTLILSASSRLWISSAKRSPIAGGAADGGLQVHQELQVQVEVSAAGSRPQPAPPPPESPPPRSRPSDGDLYPVQVGDPGHLSSGRSGPLSHASVSRGFCACRWCRWRNGWRHDLLEGTARGRGRPGGVVAGGGGEAREVRQGADAVGSDAGLRPAAPGRRSSLRRRGALST